MNKLTIPAILVATVMIAGIFAFMPVQQASTVHTSGTVTLAQAGDITDILTDTGTDIPATLTTAATAHGTAQTDLTLIVEDTGATLPGEHAALPSITEVSDIGAATTLTGPGTLLIAGTAGVAYLTCSNFSIGGSADDIDIAGNDFEKVANVDLIIAVSATDAITWVSDGTPDTATCTLVLLS